MTSYTDQELAVVRNLRALIPALYVEVSNPVRGCGHYRKRDRNDADERRVRVHYLVAHLNDRHQWTREEIADWLDTLDLDLSFPGDGRMDSQQLSGRNRV